MNKLFTKKEETLNNIKKKFLFGILILFLMAGSTCRGENVSAPNKVQTIELDALDVMITDKGFQGLVVAMASWCPPCREELPILGKMYHQYLEKGIQIVAFSVDSEGPEAVQSLINELKIPFPVYWVGKKAARHYKLVGIPTIMIYDHGSLVETLPGSHPQRIIEKKIKRLVDAQK